MRRYLIGTLAWVLTGSIPIIASASTFSLRADALVHRPPGTERALYAAARKAALRQEPQVALRQLRQAVVRGYIGAETLEQEPDLATLHRQPEWPRLLELARARQRQHEAAFHPLLMALMRKISYQDQHYRMEASKAEQQYGIGSPQAKAADAQQARLDPVLIRRVDSVLAIHGYPGKSQVGEYHKATVFLVMQHNPHEKYLPLLTAAADKGELNWSSVALLVDRLRVSKGEKQLYGSQLGAAKNDHYLLVPIEDESNVNVRRARVGLEPLEVYLKHWNITYQVPTATHNPNPSALYVQAHLDEEEKSPVELIGGNEALYAQVHYPAAARQKNIQGRVLLQLTIDAQGVPQNVTVIEGLGAGCDEEALRVMRAARFTNVAGQDHEIRMSLPFPYVEGK